MERNYKDDQTNEIEALDSIYCGDMESKLPFITTFLNGGMTSGDVSWKRFHSNYASTPYHKTFKHI